MLTRRFARALLLASIVTATQNFCDDSIRNHTVVILFVGANQDDPTFQLLRCAAVRSAVRVARRRLPKFAVRTLFVSHDRNRTVPGAHFDAVLDAPRALDVATVAVARYEHVRAMLDAVSLGAAYAADDMCAGWVWRVRLEMLVGAFDLPDDPDAAVCYGYRNQFAGKMVSDNLLFGTAATARRMFAPHDWDPAAPPDPTILDRLRPSPDFKNGPEALMEARVGSRVCEFIGVPYSLFLAHDVAPVRRWWGSGARGAWDHSRTSVLDHAELRPDLASCGRDNSGANWSALELRRP